MNNEFHRVPSKHQLNVTSLNASSSGRNSLIHPCSLVAFGTCLHINIYCACYRDLLTYPHRHESRSVGASYHWPLSSSPVGNQWTSEDINELLFSGDLLLLHSWQTQMSQARDGNQSPRAQASVAGKPFIISPWHPYHIYKWFLCLHPCWLDLFYLLNKLKPQLKI